MKSDNKIYNLETTEDIYSSTKKTQIYAKRGERVRVIGIHDNVLALESENGNRFSAKKEQVKKCIPPKNKKNDTTT